MDIFPDSLVLRNIWTWHRVQVITRDTKRDAVEINRRRVICVRYLIDSRWFKQWKKYVGFDSWDMYNVGERNLYPGPIDNSGLFSGKSLTSKHLSQEPHPF